MCACRWVCRLKVGGQCVIYWTKRFGVVCTFSIKYFQKGGIEKKTAIMLHRDLLIKLIFTFVDVDKKSNTTIILFKINNS